MNPTFRLGDREWAVLVLAFVALNAVDLGLTLNLVTRGADELNPIMAGLLDAGWEWATAFKAFITVGVAAGLWFGRHHRIVRRTGIGFVVLFAALGLYQVADMWAAA